MLGGFPNTLQHPVADEPVTDAYHHRQLAQLFCKGKAGGKRGITAGLAAHDFQQLHDMRRAEEMQTHKARGVCQP